jgi:hypothetical protein
MHNPDTGSSIPWNIAIVHDPHRVLEGDDENCRNIMRR